ncbi:hypothetical protein [Sunxiuqinia sp. sy24]|uniref:hypothetical protein n=1 Tax=Sunxiuqinia sp. sy24 TaxID=3461495 RepID=UPI0040459C63
MCYIGINTQTNDKDHKDGYREVVKDLNSEILRMTMVIRDYYPELTIFLEEIPGEISDERDLGVTINQLKSYLESLNSLLTKYILEHPISSK